MSTLNKSRATEPVSSQWRLGIPLPSEKGASPVELSIVVVSFNTRALSLACLKSVFEQTRGENMEVIVVDNASTDSSAEAIARDFPQVKLIAHSENIGFARANNLAANYARGQWLLLLNPDTVILDRAIDKVLEFAKKKPEGGIFGGRTFFADGSLNYSSCHGRPTLWSLACMGFGLSTIFRGTRFFDPESLGGWKRDTVREVDAITGCFLLIRNEMWRQLGGFNEAFYMYGEETDLCWRARKAGTRCILCPEAKLIHYGGASERIRADKIVKLFIAKVGLFREHWGRAATWFGIRMLDLWAFTRTAAFAILVKFNPRHIDSFETWRAIWRRRSEWQSVARPTSSQES